MAPPRKKRRAPGEGHPIHLRLPTDVMELVEARAKKDGCPINRAVINLIASIPDLEKRHRVDVLLERMEIVLAKYGSRVTLADLSEPILRAVDDVLTAKTDGELQARLDKLRVLRREMQQFERSAKQ
jgi:hypothetical protein